MSKEDKILIFGMSNALIERELDKVEGKLKIDLQRSIEDEKDEEYYPQFYNELRVEARRMSKHYELFYCLENSIRRLVAETLGAEYGENWWETAVPGKIKENVKTSMQREIDSGITLRSENEINFTTFGEPGEIVRNKWVNFDAIFSSEKAFTKIMTNLNILRNPIAHCCPLAEDEIVRLQLTVRDWFRLME
jgi:Swt1-like HEPN